MKQILVFDAGALALHFVGDTRIKQFFEKIDREEAEGYVADVNLSEFYYKTCQKLGRQTADIRFFMLLASPLHKVQDEILIRLAGLEKCRRRLSLSLADCYALALAKREKALLLTTDSELAKTQEVHVRFFKV